MGDEWIDCKLGELGEFRNGVNFNSTQEGIGLPVIKVKDFGDLTIAPDSGFDELNPQAIRIPADQMVEVGDTLIIRSNGNPALVGRSMLYRGGTKPTTFSGFCIRFRPDRSKIVPAFAAYFIRSPLCRQHFTAYGSGTGIQNLSQGVLTDLDISLPPLPEQRAIARVLGGLDDKIELNRRMNRTLEDLARGVFRSWFVDFDPVLRPPLTHLRPHPTPSPAPSPTRTPTTPPRFPTRLVDSPLGPIPEGWRVGTVADLCTTQYGYTASATDDAVGPRMVRVTDMNKEPWVEWADVPHCRIDDDLLPRYALKLGDVLVSRMADPGKAAIVEEVLPEGAVFASYLIRLATRSIAASYYLFYYLRSDQYLDYAESVSGGTVQKNMNAQVITAAQMVIAPDAIADEFARIVRPWRAQIAANLQESRSLAALRDALLPQLLSGEIRLREAERAVDDSLQSTRTPPRAGGPALPRGGKAAGAMKGRA